MSRYDIIMSENIIRMVNAEMGCYYGKIMNYEISV